jgi:hypothetical protein
MEWSLHISGAADLDRDFGLPEDVAVHFLDARFTRLAYGTEFCEHLLPTEEALRAVAESGRPLTLLTPYVSAEGITQLRRLFSLLYGGCEVVFNDWGVLRILRREFPHLIPVQGRLLYKSLRDPRVTTVYAETASPASESSLQVLQQSNLDNGSYATLLHRRGVHRIEVDHLPQGSDLSFTRYGMCVSVYLPFGFISTSRVCMAAGLHYRKQEKFQPGAPCRRECQSHELTYTYTNSPFQNRDQQFLLRGNTYFYRHTPAMMRTLACEAARGRIARLVYQPRLPMFFG